MKLTMTTGLALALFCTTGGVLAYQKLFNVNQIGVTKYPFIDPSIKYRPEQVLPDHTFMSEKGPVRLTSLLKQHERSLIVLAGYNCAPCLEEIKALRDIQGINSVHLILISKDPLAFRSKYAAVTRLNFTFLHDKGEAYANKTLGSESTPQTILTDRKAEILFMQSGKLMDSHGDNRLHEELPKLFGRTDSSESQKEGV